MKAIKIFFCLFTLLMFADVNARYKQEYPLHFAVINGDTESVLWQIKAGADVNAKDKYSWTPLHHAMYMGHTEIKKALIEAGADVNAKDRRGLPPMSKRMRGIREGMLYGDFRYMP